MKNVMEKTTQKLMKKTLKTPLWKSTSSTTKDQRHYDMFEDEEALLPEEILAEENETDETISLTHEDSNNSVTSWMMDEDDELEDEEPGDGEDEEINEEDDELDDDDNVDADQDLDEDEDLNEDTDEDVEDDYEGVRTKAKRK